MPLARITLYADDVEKTRAFYDGIPSGGLEIDVKNALKAGSTEPDARAGTMLEYVLTQEAFDEFVERHATRVLRNDRVIDGVRAALLLDPDGRSVRIKTY